MPDSPTREQIAAIDLGSNSFHMVVAEILADGGFRIVDRAKEMVRLGAGLDSNNDLSPESQQRALDCLSRFGQRLRALPKNNVRVVGTNTLRKARNADSFNRQAVKALGHPIEVVAGREEARLIYLGVSHSLPESDDQRLVIDIGGGSTEFIIGRHFNPLYRESLYMGCVEMSQRYFADGQIDAARMQRAQLDASLELWNIESQYKSMGWHEAVGASGTIRAIGENIRAMGWCAEGISREALFRLRDYIVRAGHIDRLDLPDLNPARAPSFPGGVAVLAACFERLDIEQMSVSDWAMREGVLYDMLGRRTKEDVRERTIFRLQQRFRADQTQADRVLRSATRLYERCPEGWVPFEENVALHLEWSARLHEIGFSIAHNQYHKHGAYILQNSDMPGFTRAEQQRMASLVRGHRRKIPAELFNRLAKPERKLVFRLCLILRLAVLLNRHREDIQPTLPQIEAKGKRVQLLFPQGWCKEHPMTLADLEREQAYQQRAGYTLAIGERL